MKAVDVDGDGWLDLITATTMSDGLVAAAFPLVTGILTAFVAYGRWRLSPFTARDRRAPRRIARQAVPQPSYRTAA